MRHPGYDIPRLLPQHGFPLPARPKAVGRPKVGWAEKPSMMPDENAGLFSPAYFNFTASEIFDGRRWKRSCFPIFSAIATHPSPRTIIEAKSYAGKPIAGIVRASFGGHAGIAAVNRLAAKATFGRERTHEPAFVGRISRRRHAPREHRNRRMPRNGA